MLSRSIMEWSDIQLFLAVARHGGLRAAAKRVHVDPSTLSRRLAGLEQAVGARLFERTAAGLELTPAGQAMVQSGERVDQEIVALGRRIVGHDRRPRGVVRVTFPGALTGFVHRAAAGILADYPGIELHLQTNDAMTSVDGHESDIAIRAAAQPPEHLAGRRFGALAAAVYASREYLATNAEPLDAPSHAWVDWDPALATKPAFVWLVQRLPSRRIVVRGLTTRDVLEAVVAGLGVGALPCVCADPNPSLVRLLDAPRDAWSDLWLLTHRDLRPAARIRAVLSALGEVLCAERPRLEGETGLRAVSLAAIR